MNHRGEFSRSDAAVVLGCVLFLVFNLGAFDARGRAHAKKMVCLSNIRKLAQAWLGYARDNDDKLVNGATGYSNGNFSFGDHTGELAWVGGYSTNPEGGVLGIKGGAMWPYLEDMNIYKCPLALPRETLNYSIVFSMNAVCHPEVQGVKGAYVKKLTEIMNPERRLVFVDEGKMTPDAFAVYYSRQQWFDGPPIRHSDGTTVSFADGHSEYWKWKGIGTVQSGWEKEQGRSGQFRPEKELEVQDLIRMQMGCWGQLGYEPAYGPVFRGP